MEGDVITLQDLFLFDFRAGLDERGHFVGALQPTGLRPYFLDKLKSVKPWIIRKEEKPVSQGEYLQTPAELEAFHQFTQCINCMLCYAACPVYGLEPNFLGPAAIALGYRYNMDSRDQGKDERAVIGNGRDA